MVPVTLDGISRRFGSTEVVRGISLHIEPSELFFLLGPSGCGKSTLLRIIAGLLEPTTGMIRFGDRDVTSTPTRLRQTAMVFQGYALWPHMTVEQNVAFGLEVRKVPAAQRRQRVAEALAAVRLGAYAARRPGQLSGGEQQRVALARALVVRPEVLLLDEPLSNLDAKLRLEMRSEIRRICRETKITTIYVTHDQEEAMSMADRVAVMESGALRQVGPPEALYRRPANRFVAEFLGMSNFLRGRVVERRGALATLQTSAGRLHSSTAPGDLSPEREATCSLRPEALRLLGSEEQAENVMTGQHLESVFLGGVVHHTIELPGPVRVRVSEASSRHRSFDGGVVRLGIEASDVVVLTE
jgi:iron(III) transport system ATP-binding protein